MKHTHLIWDWNGTLIDDVDIAVHAMNALFAAYHLPPTDRNEYRSLMEMPVRSYYEKVFDLTAVSFEETLSPLFNEIYDQEVARAPLAPGAVEALSAFRDAGCGQAVVSACEQTRLETLLRERGIDGYFSLISGAGDLLAGSKDERAAAAIRFFGVRGQNVVFLGDTRHDFEVAHAAGADCILIANGHEARELLERCPVPVADSLSDAAHLILDGGGIF